MKRIHFLAILWLVVLCLTLTSCSCICLPVNKDKLTDKLPGIFNKTTTAAPQINATNRVEEQPSDNPVTQTPEVDATTTTTTTTEAAQPLPTAPAGVTYREVDPYTLPVANPDKSLFDAPSGNYIGSFDTIGYVTVVQEAVDSEGFTWGQLSDGRGWTLVYKEILPKIEMYFRSGVGAWSTTLNMAGDGSFTGTYHDVDAGDFTDDYPGGTIYLSDFEGAFRVTDIGSHTVSLELTRLQTEMVPHTEWLEDDIRYIAGVAHGIDGGSKFVLYTPNSPVSTLPEDLYNWNYNIPDYGVLGCYALYCPKTGNVFFEG